VWHYLFISIFFIVGLAVANFFWIRWTWLYALLGIGIWFAMLGSGIHATAAGIVVAMFIPARGKYDTDTFLSNVNNHLGKFACEPGSCGYSILLNRQHLVACHEIELSCHDLLTPMQRLEHNLQPWIAFVVLPLFALANAGLTLEGMDLSDAISHPVSLGVILGLSVGKPLGISLSTYLGCRLLKISLPSGVKWSHVIGASMLGGIGFTMSLFMSGLSFTSPEYVDLSKLGIMIASIVSGVFGFLVIRSVGDTAGESGRPATE
jgi:NhaA family Na+:H+ antiporter